ncbi:MAG TPA: ArsA-related P-loop ATPase [Longimicrobiales bacterium]|nr:ArsA-related P-loop ATPase [Longimicrobiales bacterium]
MESLLSATAAHPCIFVVGKGGVGKTTTAGAIALAAADAGQLTHLITTDPAESLGDLFHAPLEPGRPAPSPCSDRLTLEAFDARGWGEAWLAPRRRSIAEIMERGTYLDEADVDGLLARSVPGIDETMGALRIAQLAKARERGVVERIVVDTAPTGHTLRLLDAGRSLGAWVAALRAMADRADIVASALLHTPVRLREERALDEIENELLVLEGVLMSAAFVVVHRAGDVVRAETRRLALRLRQRGCQVTAFVGVGADVHPLGEAGLERYVPPLRDATGCAGLRGFAAAMVQHGDGGAAGQASPPSPARAAEPDAPAPPARSGAPGPGVAATGHDTAGPDRMHAAGSGAGWIRATRWRVIWLAGKGGVGKSTCAAAVAVGLADDRAVSLFSTDPAGSLGDLFERSLGADAVTLGPTLRVQQVAAESVFAEWAAEYRGEVERVFESLGLDSAAAIDRRVLDSLLDFAPPGIDEIVSLEHILESMEREETLVLDTAPTGHFLRLLEMPELALDWTHTLMRILLRAGVAGSLDALSARVLAFAKRLKTLRGVLTDPKDAAVFVVTLDEPMVQAETGRLRAALQSAGIREAGVIVNRARSRSPAVSGRTLLAPEWRTPPAGVDALRRFFDSWVLV